MQRYHGATKLAAVAAIILSWLSTISCTLQVQPAPAAAAQITPTTHVEVIKAEFTKLHPD